MDINTIKKPYIIAEIGCNHNGETALGLKMIEEAKKCGASAVKFQYFTSENLTTNDYLNELDSGKVKLENVQEWKDEVLGLNSAKEQIDTYSNSKEQLEIFRNKCKELAIDFGCTPVDKNGVDFLADIDADFIKISSMDANNIEMLDYSVSRNMAIIISTGMATLQDIDNIYNYFRSKSYKNYSILHCVSIYPPPNEILNLNFIDTLKKLYDCDIGYSDHSLGTTMSLVAIAKGCNIIEKHFTLDKNMHGWDHKVSADPKEMTQICTEAKAIHIALGDKYKILSNLELEKRKKFRRSMVSNRNIKKGEVLNKNDFVYKRPGTGIPPDIAHLFIGKRVNRDIPKDKTIFEEYFI